MAERYCTNCGNGLGPNDAFCANCGKPTHQTAAVATPEADVEVSDPPTRQAGGTTVATQPEESKSRLSLGTFLIAIVIVFGLAYLATNPDGIGGNSRARPGGSNDNGRGGNQQAAQGADSEETFTNDNYGGLYADPDAHKGASVDIAGQLLERPEEGDGELAFQMFVDVESVDWNTIVYTDRTDLELNSDDYVRVRGEVLGSLEGENAFGGSITAPTIQATEVSPVSAGQAIDPATEVREIGQTMGNQGFEVTLGKIEFGEESTRAYVTISNNTDFGASFYTFDAKIQQGSTQADYLEDSYAYYEEEPQDSLRPGVVTEGVIPFEPVNPEQPFELLLPWTSNNYNVNSKPVVFQVSP